MCSPAKCQDGVKVRHGRYLGLQKGTAGVDLCRDRLVVWRQAANHIADPCAVQFDVIHTVIAIAPTCQAKADQHIEQIAPGRIAGEGPTSAVCAASPRCQSHDQKRGVKRP